MTRRTEIKIIVAALVAVVFLILFAVSAKSALVSSNLFTLSVVNYTTNTGTAVLVGTVTLPAATFMLQANGTDGTNFGGAGVILFGLTTNIINMTPVGYYRFTNDTITAFNLTNNGVWPGYFAYQAINVGNTNMQQAAQAVLNR